MILTRTNCDVHLTLRVTPVTLRVTVHVTHRADTERATEPQP